MGWPTRPRHYELQVYLQVGVDQGVDDIRDVGPRGGMERGQTMTMMMSLLKSQRHSGGALEGECSIPVVCACMINQKPSQKKGWTD